jgi:endonuclease YncB( thermonuclease family)
MPLRETLLNLAITAVLVLIITLVAILLKEGRSVPVAAIPVRAAKDPAPPVGSSPSAPETLAEFRAYPKARLIASRSNEADTLRILVDAQHEEAVFTLYFVDAPEATLAHPQRVQEQARYFEATQDAVLRTGTEAAAYVTQLLNSRPFTLLTRWEPVPDRSRYYALVLVETEKGKVYLADLLMQRGYARLAGLTCSLPGDVKGADDYGRYLLDLGKKARAAKSGAWGRR